LVFDWRSVIRGDRECSRSSHTHIYTHTHTLTHTERERETLRIVGGGAAREPECASPAS